MTKTKILVTGATGNTGSGLIPALLGAGVQVRALVRNPAKAETLRRLGAEIVIGDLDKPETLPAAVEGVDRIYLCTWNGPDEAKQAGDLIAAAAKTGRPYVVRHSAFGPDRSRIIRNHLAVEEALKASGLPWTFLRPTFYMQGTMMAAQTVASQGMVYMPMKDGRLAMIDVRDIIDVAAKVLTSDGHQGKTYVLTGPEAPSFHDVAATLSKVLGKPVKYVDVPPDAGRQAMLGMGIPPWIVEGYVELLAGFSESWAGKVSDDVATLLGRGGRTYEQFATDFKSAFSGPS